MKITVVGSGDAFCTGGRAHTCFLAQSGEARVTGRVIVDFGAASMASWKRLGLRFEDADAVVLSHLHGDHFGGLPFLLLDCQFVERRTKPLVIAGPPGTRARLAELLEVHFPGNGKTEWSFSWRVEEVTPGVRVKLAGFELETFPVLHSPGSSPTGLRLSDGQKIFAYSGDTAWTEALVGIAADADLFICECYSGGKPAPYHLDWEALRPRLGAFTAKRVMLTHMSASAHARADEMRKAGLLIAGDGEMIEF